MDVWTISDRGPQIAPVLSAAGFLPGGMVTIEDSRSRADQCQAFGQMMSVSEVGTEGGFWIYFANESVLGGKLWFEKSVMCYAAVICFGDLES
jgi:hypothetical protein